MIIQRLHDLSGLLLAGLDLAGTAVFAISGALAAARARQTLLTFSFFAIATGTGGSTVSELLIGAPVVWVHDPAGIFVCLVVALLTWVTPLAFWPSRAIDWFDALGSQPTEWSARPKLCPTASRPSRPRSWVYSRRALAVSSATFWLANLRSSFDRSFM